MADNLNITTPSKLDIYSKLLDIAENYVGGDDVDYLKTGLFGYITESMAMMIRDSALHKSMLYNESFLNTAIIPESVYNWAKMFNVEVSKASPAYATIKIIIDSESLGSSMNSSDAPYPSIYGIEGNPSNKWLIIDKGNMIIAGEYYFSLEHSILIEKKSNDSNDRKYTAKYITSEPVSTEYQTVNSNVLLPVITNGSNIEITARAYQYRVEKIERQLSSTRMLNKVQLYDFEDQFAAARLVYIENGTTNEQEIKLLYSNIGTSDGEKVAYYSLNSKNQLEITFKGGNDGFIPAANSKLRLYLYTTKGADVPANFSGDAIFRFNDDALRQLPIVVQFSPTTIIGGTDVPSTEKIKQTVIRQLSTCNTIVTENDINNYFSVLTSLLESVNNGKVTFIKTRDDIMKRVFNAYVLLRDGMNEDGTELSGSSSFISKCVPTNTLTVTFPASAFANNQTLVFPKITLDNSTNTYVFNKETNADYYFSPFYIYVSLSPIKKVKYIYNLTDCTSSLSCSEDKIDFGDNYINPISIRLYRGIDGNGAPEKKYSLYVTLSSNFESEANAKTAFENISSTITFSNAGESSTNITINEPESISFDEDSQNITLEYTINVAESEFNFNSNTSDYGTKINISDGINNLNTCSLKESHTVSLKLSKGDSENIYLSDDKLYLFRSLDEIMNSDISVNTKTENSTDNSATLVETITGITVSDIPVVHSSYVSEDTNNKDKFIEQLFTYISLLKENLDRLETSTFFNLKFYNTYGPSYIYNTTTTNIKLELRIHINTNDQTLIDEIKSYVRRSVDKSNDNSAVKISQIVALLGKDETYGQYITYIEFNGLNGTYNQYINKNTGVDETEYPPEWLNISKDDLASIDVVYDA